MSHTKEYVRWFMIYLMLLMPIQYALAVNDTANTPPPYPEEINIIVDFPQYSGSDNLRLNGTTVPNTVVDAYVNGELFATALSDDGGAFLFRRIILQDVLNNVTLIATRDDDLTAEVSAVIEVDDIDPEVTLDAQIPAVIKDPNYEITGSVSEPSTLVIELNDENDGGFEEVNTMEVDGDFTYNLNLDEGNTEYILTFYDKARNTKIFSGFVYVDTTDPRILEDNLDRISPTYSRDVTIKGRVSEPATVQLVLDARESGFECSDGIDNDEDGLTDYPFDPGCNSPTDLTELNPVYNYACSDGIDNDGDGRIDFPDDLGCDSPIDEDETNYNGTATQCSDGIDNDGDGLVDFNPANGGDWGCSSLSDDDESDDPDIGSVFTTKTDDDGYFEKEVSLPFSVQTSVTNAFSSSVENINNQEGGVSLLAGSTATDTSIEIRAIDRVGRTAKKEGTIRYATCAGEDSDFGVFMTRVFPTSIIPDHVFQGMARVSFELELEPFTTEKITTVDVNVMSRPLSDEDEDDMNMDIFNARKCSTQSTSDKSKWYITCELDRWPPNAYQNITSAYKEFEEIGSVNLPLNLQISYTVETSNLGEIVRQDNRNQLVCTDLEFPLDIRLDPDDIPVELLNSTIEIIDETINTIDQILPVVAQVKWIVFGGYIGMYGWTQVNNLGATGACFGISQKGKDFMDAVISGSTKYEVGDREEMLLDAFDKDKVGKYIKELVDKATLQFTGYENAREPARSCLTFRENLLRNIDLMNNFGDRIFCPAVPSAQKFAYDMQVEKVATNACSNEHIEKIFPGQTQLGLSAGTVNTDVEKTLCAQNYINQWDSGCMGVNPWEESKRQANINDDSATGFSNSVNTLFSGLSICEFGRQGDSGKTRVTTERGGTTIITEPGKNGGSDRFKLGSVSEVGTANDDRTIEDENKYWNELPVKNGGGTSEPYLTKVGSCVVTQPEGGLDLFDNSNTEFYETTIPRDSEAGVFESRALTPVSEGRYVDSSGLFYELTDKKDASGKVVDGKVATLVTSGDDATNAIIKKGDSFEQVPFDPNDPPEDCYNTNAISANGAADIIVDPTSSVINSARCVCLPAIEGYLISIKNILSAIKNCFESILISGEFSPGMCKALLSQYLCDFVYDALGCFVGTAGFDGNMYGNDREEPNQLAKFFGDLRDGGDKIKKAASERYGAETSFRKLFNERQLVRSACLAAFGFDWQPDLEAALSVQGGGVEINSTGMVSPATRRFMGYDPINEGFAEHVYHVGYFLTAGAPLNWRLELICSTTNDCDPEVFENGRCDCGYANFNRNDPGAYNPNAQSSGIGAIYANGGNTIGGSNIGITRVLTGGQLEGGETVGSGGSSPYGQVVNGRNSGEIYERVTGSAVRFDAVRLCWTPMSGTGKAGCVGPVKVRQVGGNYPPFCSISISTGKFSCGYFSSSGAAYIEQVNEWRNGGPNEEPNGEEALGKNEDIKYQVLYEHLNEPKESQLSFEPEIKKKYLNIEIIDGNNRLIYTETTLEDTFERENGEMTLPSTKVTPASLIERRNGVVESPTNKGISYTPEGSSSITVTALDPVVSQATGGNAYIFIKYDSETEKPSYTKVISESKVPSSWLGADENWRKILPEIIKEPANWWQETNFIDADKRVIVADLKYNDLNTIKATRFNIDYSDCKADGDVCYSFFKLEPSVGAETFDQRCSDNQNKPLQWKVNVKILEGDDQNSAVPSGAPQGRKSQINSIPLTISCGDVGSSSQPTLCEYNTLLAVGSKGCYCKEDSGTTTEFVFKPEEPKMCIKAGGLEEYDEDKAKRLSGDADSNS